MLWLTKTELIPEQYRRAIQDIHKLVGVEKWVSIAFDFFANALFLLKWLALAYTIEVLMIRFIPAEQIVTVLGGTGFLPILAGGNPVKQANPQGFSCFIFNFQLTMPSFLRKQESSETNKPARVFHKIPLPR